MNNFPLNDCIEQQQCATDEILALKNSGQNNESAINEKSSIFDFFFTLIRKMHSSIDTENHQPPIKYNIICLSKELANFKKWTETLKSEEMRRTIVEDGYEQADAFLLEHLEVSPALPDITPLLGCESTINKLN
jgi:hypothetical protein